MSTSEEVAVVDGDNVIAPSSSTRVTPRDPPTSAEEEENGRVTSTSASNNNIHDATAPTTRRRDSNFSRSTDPTTNVSQRRRQRDHHFNNHRHSRQSQSQQVSVRNGSGKRGEEQRRQQQQQQQQRQKVMTSSRPSSAKGTASGGSLERLIGKQVGGGHGGAGHGGGGDDGTYACSDLTLPTALQQLPRRNNKSDNEYDDNDEEYDDRVSLLPQIPRAAAAGRGMTEGYVAPAAARNNNYSSNIGSNTTTRGVRRQVKWNNERDCNAHVAAKEETVSRRRPKEDDNDGGDDTKSSMSSQSFSSKSTSLSSMGYGGKSLLMNSSNNNNDNNNSSSSSNKRPWFARGGGVSTTGSVTNNHIHNHLHNDIQTKSAITGVRYRTATSTRYALEEIRKRRVQQLERKRAVMILGFLFTFAVVLHFVTKSSSGHAAGIVGSMKGYDVESSSGKQQIKTNMDGDQLEPKGGGEMNAAVGVGGAIEEYEYKLPPPIEKTYDREHEYLLPLRHFSDVSDPYRADSDTAFFFHVPRSGGSTVKTLLGKCLRLVQASEVGARDGHDTDSQLSVLEVNESRFVNVDTTTVSGIQRAIDLGLTLSGHADVIVSSYFQESASMFDLHHQGRAFVILRDPIERATSMYYHRVKTLANLDASVTIEDYAQGNGIENNWMCRFLTNRMSGELTKEDLDQAKVVIQTKFLIGFLDDLEESIHQIMKFNSWIYSDDETAKMKQEDCIRELISVEGRTNANVYKYEIPKRGSQAYALISWQTQFDSKLYAYAKELFDKQTKEWGTKDRKKALKKDKKNKKGG